ncbi:MAG: helicase [Candidatus Cloacimonetes bacterium]|nr:helicase [Candidatus Cloacimonadota bacterium]
MSNNIDLTFFTNEEGRTLVDRFKSILKDVRYFDILVGYFRTSGFYQLYESFENIEKIRILVGLNTDKKTYQIIEKSRESNFLDFESHIRVKEIYEQQWINEVNNAPDEIEIEEGILKFIEYLKNGKIEIKAYPSTNLHAKVYVSRYFENDRDFGNVITGSSNFSESGLVANREFNVQLKNYSDVKFALNQFEELWCNAVDISDYYVETITQKTFLNESITPYELFLKFLYEYFQEDLSINEELFYKNYPDNFLKLKYQEQAVVNARKILNEYGGVFLSDVVGLGKTFISALLANQLPGRNLVIASPALLSKDNPNSWVNVFHDFKIASEFESIGKLEKIIERGTDRYDNVFIDEAHKFRNETNISYENLAAICRGKKVILVTATPLNNSPMDILSQIKLFQKGKNSTIPGIKNLEAFFNHLNKKVKTLDRKDDYEFYIETVRSNAKEIRDKILKHIMVRRTRFEVDKFFKDDLTSQGLKFPKVEAPEPIFYQLDSKLDKIFTETIKLITDKESFKYARYTPLLYLDEGLSAKDQTFQRNMGGFMRILLIKRLESSFEAFKNTLNRFVISYENFIEAFNKGYVFLSKKYWNKIIEFFLNDDFEAIEKLIENEKAEKFSSKLFRKDFLVLLKKDLSTLKYIKEMWSKIDYDPKLNEFVHRLKTDKILKKNKLIIFTESTETAEYLKKELKKALNIPILLYHGAIHKSELSTVISNFDAKARKPKDTYRILISTEVLSEGVSLHRSNVVLNYDIPWNPTRMIQRVGRINRVDTDFNKIYTYNFFPTEQSNDIIKLNESANAKISYFIEMLGNDAKLLTDGEEIKSFELFSKLTSKEFILGEDQEEESELKYLNIIKSIRDNDNTLFSKIKNLPQKARTARKITKTKNLKNNSLLTYFRKGKLEKFFIATEIFSQEIDFITSAQLLNANPETRRSKILNNFYDLLRKNKSAIIESLEAEELIEEVSNRGRTNSSRILKILKSKEMRKFSGFTEFDEEYLKKTKKLLEEGALPKSAAKRIFNEIKDFRNPYHILAGIKRNLPNEFFKSTQTARDISRESLEEIIISEYFIK